MKITFFISGKNDPSSRYRILQFIPKFEKMGIRCKIIKPFPNKFYTIQIKNLLLMGILNIFLLFIKFISLLIQIPLIIGADICLIQKEIFLYNIIFFEKIIFKMKKRVIFDFDDAIFLNSDFIQKSIITNYLSRNLSRLPDIIKRSNSIIVGNEYLAQYAKKFNSRIEIIPTVIDTEIYTKKKDENNHRILRLGWMGTCQNLKYLKEKLSVLKAFHDENPEVVLIICSNCFKYFQEFNSIIPTKYILWSSENEVKILHLFDVGLMPLLDSEWAKGKCSFKLIQYMACGVAAIGSAIGQNKQLIFDGFDGFLAETDNEWVEKIGLLKQKNVRERIIENARKKIENEYSINSALNHYIKIFLCII